MAIAWFGLANLSAGLEVRAIPHNSVPMLFMTSKGAKPQPGIVVAHGIAGSKQLMLGYGYTLAHNGYSVLLLDFHGHGANTAPLDQDRLQQDLNTALTALKAQPEVDPNRIGLLGHSMGSGAVMTAGAEEGSSIAAVVAVSPIHAPLTPSAPRNLQLQAGEWEGPFVQQSAQLLQDAGGPNANLKEGKGRSQVIIPHVEHILILFSDRSHQAALDWFDAAFEQTSTSSFRDRRMVWYGLHLLSWILLLSALSPWLQQVRSHLPIQHRPGRSWVGLGIAPLSAAGIIFFISWQTSLASIGGLLVGGALGLWMFVAGLTWCGVLSRFPRPSLKSLGLGVLLFGLLWLAFGAMAQETWLQWWLIPARLKLWPVLAFACFPWFLASGILQIDATRTQQILGWLAQSVALAGGLSITIVLVPQLGFLALIVPIIPIVLALLSYTGARVRNPWSYAIASALFFGWTIAATFPLSA
ncbi:alpha/beta hydrolase [Altericista sp. CCNU0014]|uniref:alpha/beta hydrolase n=1 Tax=Altericista sp. CCNU0014 TaxID=3082949 RepID=UPI00384C3307